MDGASEPDNHCPADPGTPGGREVLNMRGLGEEKKGPWILFSSVTGWTITIVVLQFGMLGG